MSFAIFVLPITSAQADGLPIAFKHIPAHPVQETWLSDFCQTEPFQACLAAQSWAWFRAREGFIDTSTSVLGAASLIYAAGWTAERVLGERAATTYMISFSQTAMKAASILFVGSVVVIFGLALNATFSYFALTTPTGGYLDDKPEIALACQGVDLKQYLTPQGQEKLLTMTQEEFLKIAPCIPENNDLLTALTQGAANGQDVENSLPN